MSGPRSAPERVDHAPAHRTADRALKRFDILNFVQHEDERKANHDARSAAAC